MFAAGLTKAWAEFKGLSKTHLIVILVIIMLLIGALRWADIKALLTK